jgi:hypothetical protein
VVWTNKNYKMLYLNMGHNDIDYEHRYDATNKTLSYTFNNPIQDRLIIDGLLWLGDRRAAARADLSLELQSQDTKYSRGESSSEPPSRASQSAKDHP